MSGPARSFREGLFLRVERTTVGLEAAGALLGFPRRRLPPRTPFRPACGDWPSLDRARSGLPETHVAAAEEAKPGVIVRL
jgi:hypothetical protein